MCRCGLFGSSYAAKEFSVIVDLTGVGCWVERWRERYAIAYLPFFSWFFHSSCLFRIEFLDRLVTLAQDTMKGVWRSLGGFLDDSEFVCLVIAFDVTVHDANR